MHMKKLLNLKIKVAIHFHHIVLPNVNHESEQWLGTLTLTNVFIVPQKKGRGFFQKHEVK